MLESSVISPGQNKIIIAQKEASAKLILLTPSYRLANKMINIELSKKMIVATLMEYDSSPTCVGTNGIGPLKSDSSRPPSEVIVALLIVFHSDTPCRFDTDRILISGIGLGNLIPPNGLQIGT